MLHFTTIEHGPNRYILMPYAPYGDLEVFLHCGIEPGPERRKQYDFDKRFNKVKNNDITLALLAQCWSLADALHWLHNGIKIENSSSTVFCAHMDLKPANILIKQDEDEKSVVGMWVISDFGISVLEDQKDKEEVEYGSIGDYIKLLTMNTRPKRIEGTYQAPEVKLSEDIFGLPSHLTPDQRGVGRKSDIWSFGCILSEVLAFSLGKDPRDSLVREFQAARREAPGNDYFYSEKDSFLNVASAPKEYHVRLSVLLWLDKLCKRAAAPQRWVDCFVGTIKSILVVDTEYRPDSGELLKLVGHVKHHVSRSLGSEAVSCSILEPKPLVVAGPRSPGINDSQTPPCRPPPQKPVNTPSSSPKSDNHNSALKVYRSTTFEQEVIHSNDDLHSNTFEQNMVDEDNNKECVTRDNLDLDQQYRKENASAGNFNAVPSALEGSNSLTSGDENTNPRQKTRPVVPGQKREDRSESDRIASSGTMSSHSSSFSNPVRARGIMVEPAVPMSPTPSICVGLPKPLGSSLKITPNWGLPDWTIATSFLLRCPLEPHSRRPGQPGVAPVLSWPQSPLSLSCAKESIVRKPPQKQMGD
jgi:serine/threonine protein kinase